MSLSSADKTPIQPTAMTTIVTTDLLVPFLSKTG